VPDEKPTTDKALELLVYAPVGVALYVRDMLPTMMTVFVSRGKREVQSHLPGQPPTPPVPTMPTMPTTPSPADVRRKVEEGLVLAKVVTESGLGVAIGVAGSGLGFARGLADTAVQGLGTVQGPWIPGATGSDPTADAPEQDTAPAATPTPTAVGEVEAEDVEAADEVEAEDVEAAEELPAPDVASLAIPDYDELSASQVVERLEGLDPASLEAIRRYESAHRGRNTILGKISRLR